MKHVGPIAAIACLVAATPAFAGVIGSGNDSAYRTLASYYSSVGQIQGYDASGEFAASGVVIAPNWILTAGHVVSGATSLNFFLDGGGDFSSFASRTAIAANSWTAYSKYDGNLNSGYDIGLIHVATDLVATYGVTAAVLYSGIAEVGKVGTMVGYGMTGTGATGATTFDGLKRAGQNMIDAVAITPGKDNRILLSDFDSGLASDNSYGSAFPLSMEYMIAPGDSGGGLFIPCGSPTSYADDCLAGITSFGWGRLDGNPDSDFGDVGGFTRVSSFVTWINSIINPQTAGGGGGKGGGPRGTSALMATAVAVPEPVTVSMFGVGLAAILATRRRRKRNTLPTA